MSYPTLDELNLIHANLCRALSDPKRILILYALFDRPRHVTALAARLDIPQPTVSRHLRRLQQHGLVCSERDGPSVIYSIADPRIMDLLDLMREVRLDALTQQSSVVARETQLARTL